jgi:hypothetical protein
MVLSSESRLRGKFLFSRDHGFLGVNYDDFFAVQQFFGYAACHSADDESVSVYQRNWVSGGLHFLFTELS